jgi:hypothetical protein
MGRVLLFPLGGEVLCLDMFSASIMINFLQ